MLTVWQFQPLAGVPILIIVPFFNVCFLAVVGVEMRFDHGFNASLFSLLGGCASALVASEITHIYMVPPYLAHPLVILMALLIVRIAFKTGPQ